MKRTLIALATAAAVTTTSITAVPAVTTAPESSVSEQTSSAAESTSQQATTEPKNKSSIGGSSSKDGGWSPTGSTPLDLVLLIAGALGISFLVQPFIQGDLNQVINNLKKQLNIPM